MSDVTIEIIQDPATIINIGPNEQTSIIVDESLVDHAVTHISGGSDELLHNKLTLQGGQVNEYYHLTSGQYANLVTGSVIRPEDNILYTTGDQSISGEKIFLQRPLVNGTGVMLFGEALSGDFLPLSGGAISGNLEVNGRLLVDTISSGLINAISGNLNLIGSGSNQLLIDYDNTVTIDAGVGVTISGGPLTVNNGSINSSTPLALTQTWATNATYTGLQVNITDSGPSNAASLLMDLRVGGATKFSIRKDGRIFGDGPNPFINLSTAVGTQIGYGNAILNNGGNSFTFTASGVELFRVNNNSICSLSNTGSFSWSSTSASNGVLDLFLTRDAANTLAQRNGANAQAFRLYNTYTSGTSFERLNFRWDSNTAKIGTEKGSAGGVARDLVLETNGTERVRVSAAGVFSVDGVVVGRGAGAIATNTAAGFEALAANTTGINNAVFGYRSMPLNTTGGGNTGIGSACLFKNTTGGSNTAIGLFALFDNVTGSENTALGARALQSNTGSQNTAVGLQSLISSTTGVNNSAVGANSGRFIADGATANTVTSTSVYIGANTKALASGQTNQIVIGFDAIGLGSNTAVLGNDSIVTTALKGNVGIGTTSPASKLTVTGGDAEITDIGSGIILKSPNGTRWRVAIDDTGALTTTAL